MAKPEGCPYEDTDKCPVVKKLNKKLDKKKVLIESYEEGFTRIYGLEYEHPHGVDRPFDRAKDIAADKLGLANED